MGITTKSLYLTLMACSIAMMTVPAVADTISGTVSVDGAGPISGARVMTDGEPVYSSITGTDGHYSITVPLVGSGNAESPGKRWAVLASATGYNPQRATTDAGGASVTVSFALRAVAVSGQPLNFPAPIALGEPPSAPNPPGDSFPVSFADTGALPAANAPKISDFNDFVKPDESFTITGYNFTTQTGSDAGMDTTVWVWARTSASGGVLKQAKLWKVSNGTIVATLPDDIPAGMYLVWVQNSSGVSAPVCLNRTLARWLGPIENRTYPGGTKRVFGRNLTYNHGVTRAGSSDPVTTYVYIQPASGGAFIPCVTSIADHPSAPNVSEPYAVSFTVPLGTPNGNYRVFVHNGQGGVYGWSDGLDLVVQSQWARGPVTLQVGHGTDPNRDDAPAIQNAINTVGGYSSGGTVQLSSGDYILRSQVVIGSGAQLQGAGTNSTNLLLEAPSGHNGTAVILLGSNPAISDLTIHEVYGYALPSSELAASGVSGAPAVVSGVRVDSDQGMPGTSGWENVMAASPISQFTEMRGCEMHRAVLANGSCWLHDNNFYGDVGPWVNAEAATELRLWRNVFENNHTETLNWPIGVGGTRNYNWWDPDPSDPGSTLYYRVWAKRVALTYCSYSYMAHNTSKDVAVDDNKGEMFLFHGHGASWCGQVLSNSGLTMTVRTDGLVFGKPCTIVNYSDKPLVCGQPVTDDFGQWWSYNVGRTAVIIAGKGAGQARPILWTGGVQAPNKIIVDRPWAVEPDSTSVVQFTGEYTENVIYANDLNSFPTNYTMDLTASCPAQFNNSVHGVFEANTARRNFVGLTFASNSGGATLFTEARDNQVMDAWANAYAVLEWDDNPLGPCLYGNVMRSSSGNTLSQNGVGTAYITGEGSMLENMSVTGSVGYQVGWNGATGNGSPNLFRNGTVMANSNPKQPVYVKSYNGSNLLINNSYAGNPQAYWYNGGVSSYTTPVALYRVARFNGYTGGGTIQDILVAIANAGTDVMPWTVTTSDPWITARVQSNGALAPESTLGRLDIGVNPSGLAAGSYSGSVTLSTGNQSVKVGVSFSLASGSPPNQFPVALFTPTPAVGTAPRQVSFNASASYDPDGPIASYYWDFGDGGYGTGATAGHTYAQGTYTPVLTVTDSTGLTSQTWTNITVSPTLVSVALSGTPGAPIDPGTPVTLTASATGGYQTQYRFLVNSNGTGWTPITPYQSAVTTTWTPAAAGYYEIKAYARTSDSGNTYDVVSNILSYPVGQIPKNGMAVWLKADSGVTIDATSSTQVTGWADQSGSGNNVTQTNSSNEPSYVTGILNGRPVIRFGGGSQMLQAGGLVLAGNTNFTTFEVVKPNAPIAPSTYQYFWWNGDNNYQYGYGSYLNALVPPKLECGWGARTPKIYAPDNVAAGTWYRISSRLSGAADPKTHEMWVNGVYVTTTNTKSGSNLSGAAFSVGNFGPASTKGLNGDIAELLIYNRDLSEAERTSVESYLSARWDPPVVTQLDRIKDVKSLADGVPVSIRLAKVVIAASNIYADGGYYIEEPDRTIGMKVVGGPTVSLWDNVTLTGTTGTDKTTGEKILTVAGIDSQSPGATALVSLGMTNKAFAANGQLARVWGRVTAKLSNGFVVDDGSGSPVTVETDGLVSAITKTVNVGDYVSASGPAGLASGGIAVVRPRSDTDIQVY